ncbi:MAG: hypothetical protein GXP31_07685 [Kiritimatiellaeota bacterium]|nr:hypothetical protein [Kiritimatiellota bacterium]
MIERMKKVAVVCLADDRTQALERLRELGTVHLVDVQEPASQELEALTRRRDAVARASSILAGRKGASDASLPAGVRDLSAEDLADEILRLSSQSAEAENKASEWLRIRRLIEPWGSFSMADLQRIEAGGFQVILATAAADQLPELPEGAVLREIRREGKTVWFVVIVPDGVEVDVPRAPLPETTDIEQVDAALAASRRQREETEAMLAALKCLTDRLKQGLDRLDAEIEYIRARDGMGEKGRLVFLQGFVPVSQASRLAEAAQEHGWAVRIEDPADDDEQVPTRIVLPKWVEPIRSVFQALGITPGYREVDISAWFLLFLSIFFAMLIGDAGYGLLFLAVTLVARRKYRTAPASPFWLFGIFSAATIIWGVMTGTYFGVQGVPAPLAGFEVAWLKDPTNVQRLCFLLGAIHLSIAHGWNALIFAPRLKALGEISWGLILWGNYFLARTLVVGDPMPSFTVPVFYGVGIVGVVLFSSPQRNPLKTVGAGLGALLLGIVGSFVDLVSYIRLYAVGAASLAIEQTFNQMAAGMHLPFWLTPLVAALILAAGHGLNILLGAMAVVVHGIRLNVLEFSTHLGLQWAGVPYRPFAHREPAASGPEG